MIKSHLLYQLSYVPNGPGKGFLVVTFSDGRGKF